LISLYYLLKKLRLTKQRASTRLSGCHKMPDFIARDSGILSA